MKKLTALLSVASLIAMTSPVFAGQQGGNAIDITNNNSADVHNSITITANTGNNTSIGGDVTGSGGTGGSVNVTSEEKSKPAPVDPVGGNGGDIGNGGNGGSITTGDANATVEINNDVNRNDTVVEFSTEKKVKKMEDPIVNNNEARVDNCVSVDAYTGNNASAGGYVTGNGGEGGSVNVDTKSEKGGKSDSTDSIPPINGGNGGSIGNGGNGGDIKTGVTNSIAKIVNVINKNITRVKR
jgi:hypothetical protein